jgi:hypothetical protein
MLNVGGMWISGQLIRIPPILHTFYPLWMKPLPDRYIVLIR